MSVELIELEEEEYTSQLTGPVFRRIVGLLKPHWRWVLGFFITIALTSVTDSYFTFINKQIIDQGISLKDTEALTRLAILYGGLIVVQAGMVFAFIYLAGVLGERVQYDLRKMLFNHLQELSLSYYAQTAVGRLMARVTSDTGRVSELVTWGVVDITWSAMNITTATIFMLIINWKLGLIVLAAVPILMIIAVQFRKRILVQFRASRRANSKITGAYNENIAGVRVVKALGREDENLEEFQQLTDDMYRASYRAAWLSALFLPTVQIVSAFALGSIVWYSGIQAQVGGMTIGGIHAFVTYLTFMLWPVQELARVYAEMQHSIASAERIFKLVDTAPEVHDRPEAVPASTLLGEIAFEQVDFYYEDRNPVLTDFNLKVKAGETIALVGPTGGGKSTIVNLLCRFYEPRTGAIRINGQDYRDYTLEFDPFAGRHRAADPAPVLRDSAREHPLRTAGRHRPGHRNGGQDRRRARFHRHTGKELRPERGRGRQPAVGWPEAVDQPGESRAFAAGTVHHGRGHLQRGYAHRGAHPARHGSVDEGAHVLRDRAPPEHHPARGPHPGHRGWAHQGTGHACRAAAPARALLPAVHAAIPSRPGSAVWRDGSGGR